jgi:hypothetical protein
VAGPNPRKTARYALEDFDPLHLRFIVPKRRLAPGVAKRLGKPICATEYAASVPKPKV